MFQYLINRQKVIYQPPTQQNKTTGEREFGTASEITCRVALNLSHSQSQDGLDNLTVGSLITTRNLQLGGLVTYNQQTYIISHKFEILDKHGRVKYHRYELTSSYQDASSY